MEIQSFDQFSYDNSLNQGQVIFTGEENFSMIQTYNNNSPFAVTNNFFQPETDSTPNSPQFSSYFFGQEIQPQKQFLSIDHFQTVSSASIQSTSTFQQTIYSQSSQQQSREIVNQSTHFTFRSLKLTPDNEVVEITTSSTEFWSFLGEGIITITIIIY